MKLIELEPGYIYNREEIPEIFYQNAYIFPWIATPFHWENRSEIKPKRLSWFAKREEFEKWIEMFAGSRVKKISCPLHPFLRYITQEKDPGIITIYLKDHQRNLFITLLTERGKFYKELNFRDRWNQVDIRSHQFFAKTRFPDWEYIKFAENLSNKVILGKIPLKRSLLEYGQFVREKNLERYEKQT
jgi:hypothetical protein